MGRDSGYVLCGTVRAAAGRALQGFRAAKQRAIGLEHVLTL